MKTTFQLSVAALSLSLLASLFGACATTPSQAAFTSRFPRAKDVVKAAREQPWGAELKQIPATVIEVGELANVPYVSFGNGTVELNVYGDPASPAGIEVGAKDASPETRAALKAFIGSQLNEADRKPLDGMPEGKEVEADGMTLEITPPEAADGFGAWWVTASQKAGIKQAQASVGELNELALEANSNDDYNAATMMTDVGAAPGFIKFPRYRPGGKRIYATNYYKENGVYRRRK
ncbi:MAG: hypothetical protein U0228_10370 [Myxococcaceae bacterium]